MKRILLTTIHRPLGIESETCSPAVVAEMYHAQVTRAQGVFSIRSVCTGWGLDFIAANLEAPVTVLHYPTERVLLRELKKGYDYIGINFVICSYPKALEIIAMVRRHAPATRIVLGGYGTVLDECDAFADLVCREEGVGFFRRLLGEPPRERFIMPDITRTLRIMSVTSRPEAILATGLGCSRGCEFCSTSHFYGRHFIPLVHDGRALHEAMTSVRLDGGSCRTIGVIDEDFLADRARIEEMIPLNAEEVERPILFSCLTSLRSLTQYSIDELLMMGLYGAWVGIESRRADYPKLRGIDAPAMVERLKAVGVNMLTSMILGYDWHDAKTIEEDFDYLMSLRPTFAQMMLFSPCPKTPLFERLKAEGRLLDAPYMHYDGFHALFRHPHFSGEELERMIVRFFAREYEELGPSICRVCETQLDGYAALRGHDRPVFRARAREHARLARDIYPLLATAVRRAPSPRVRDWLKGLKTRAEELLEITAADRLKSAGVPLLALHTDIMDRIRPNPQPKVQVRRYRWNTN